MTRDGSNLDSGYAITGGARLRRLLIFSLAAVLFFTFYQQHRFRGLDNPAAMEHAQLGRALAEGRGYQTRMLRPIALGTMISRRPGVAHRGELPEMFRAPLYPATLAVAFRLLQTDFTVNPRGRTFAPETRAVLPLGWFFTLATAWLIFLAANRFFDRRVAALAPLAYLLSQTVLQRTLSGLPDTMAALLAAAAFTAALSAAGDTRAQQPAGTPRNVAAALAAGVLTGLAILCSYPMILFTAAPLLACIMAAPPRRRVLVTVCFAFAALSVTAPWIVRNLQLSGHPLGLAHLEILRQTAVFPGQTLERSLSWNPDATPLGLLLRRRWLANLAGAGWIARWCASGEALFPALALLMLLAPGPRHELRRLRWPLLAASVMLLAADPLSAPDVPGRLLYPLLPWLILLGCAALVRLLDLTTAQWPVLRQAICAAVLLLHAMPVIAGLLGPRARIPYPPVYPPFVAAAGALIADDELLVSDIPWATAWYGNQRTLWLPNTLDEFFTVNDNHQTVAALHLTTETGSRPYVGDLLNGANRDWLPFIEGRLPAGFPLTEGLHLPPGSRDQILLIGPGRFAAKPRVE